MQTEDTFTVEEYIHTQTNTHTHTHTHTHTYTNTYTLSVPDKKCPRDSSPRGVPAVQFHNHSPSVTENIELSVIPAFEEKMAKFLLKTLRSFHIADMVNSFVYHYI